MLVHKTILHFRKSLNIPLLPAKNLHRHCFLFLLGYLHVPREFEYNMQNFWGVNTMYYGICESREWQNVAIVLHNDRIKFPKDFFRYCSVHQHGRRHVTWKPRVGSALLYKSLLRVLDFESRLKLIFFFWYCLSNVHVMTANLNVLFIALSVIPRTASVGPRSKRAVTANPHIMTRPNVPSRALKPGASTQGMLNGRSASITVVNRYVLSSSVKMCY